MHFLGGSNIEVVGNRAITMTKMTISQRAPVHDVVVDVLCSGRFYDFFEKRNGKWAIVLRRLFYEKDRLDPVTHGAVPRLDAALLERFPIGYRHLAYLQTRVGYKVKDEARTRITTQPSLATGIGWSCTTFRFSSPPCSRSTNAFIIISCSKIGGKRVVALPQSPIHHSGQRSFHRQSIQCHLQRVLAFNLVGARERHLTHEPHPARMGIGRCVRQRVILDLLLGQANVL